MAGADSYRLARAGADYAFVGTHLGRVVFCVGAAIAAQETAMLRGQGASIRVGSFGLSDVPSDAFLRALSGYAGFRLARDLDEINAELVKLGQPPLTLA